MDLKVTDLKSYDRELSKNLIENYLNESISKQAKNQLANIDDQDDKMLNLLLKSISKFHKEIKTLREQNKKLRIELNNLQILLKNTQKDVERSKEKYKLLNGINKGLSYALKNSITYNKLTEEDHSEETLEHISLVEERILVDSTQRNNGLLKFNNIYLYLVKLNETFIFIFNYLVSLELILKLRSGRIWIKKLKLMS